MTIEVDLYKKLRHLHEHEKMSQRAIAKMPGVSRNTVKRYYSGEQVPCESQGVSGRQKYVVTAKVRTFINDCLAEDENIKEQSHTAKRIYDRLVDEKTLPAGNRASVIL